MENTMNTHIMFQEKKLIIPDFVSPLDIEKIKDWFEKYEIAKVNSVTFHLHEEPEYYVEDKNDYYGYAIIEIDEWLNNTCACNFYENIYNLNGKMVFDDPYYWEIEFYDYSKHKNHEYYNTYDYSNVPNSPTPSEKDMCTTEYLESEEEEEEEEEEYDDDKNDPDYVYKSTDEEEDYEYEYEYNMYKKLEKSGKETKTKHPEEEVLDDVVVVNNKNYMKRDKRKSFKNVWVRRLRQKHEVEY